MSYVIWICINLPIAIYYSIVFAKKWGEETAGWLTLFAACALINWVAVAVNIWRLT